MIKKEYLLIFILLIIILAFGLLIVNNISDNTIPYNSTGPYHEVIANNSADPGSVEVIRNIGNPNGKKIAYVVGVHPLENETHQTLINILPNISDLNYSYDIYIINVSEDIGYYGDGSSDDNQGRTNGQNLAYKYVYPEIIKNDYVLTVDVHSNIGAYPYNTFVFSPVKESLGSKYADEVAENCQNISYYIPESTTSGPYLTIPLNENGVPAFYYEEYSFAPQDEKDIHMMELINAVDNLIL